MESGGVACSVRLFLISGSLLSVGMASLGPAVGMAYMDPTPVVAHTLSAEIVEGKTRMNGTKYNINTHRRLESATSAKARSITFVIL